MINLFESLILGVMSEADRKLSQVDFLSLEDRERVREWNATLPSIENNSSSCTIHGLVEAMAARQPEAIAIASWDGQLTYHQLDELSTKLACHLRGLGVGQESLVVHCFTKSVWAVVAIISVLKAGAACVSISPESPRARTRAILEDTKALVALVAPDTLGSVEDLVDHPVIVDAAFFGNVHPPELSLPHVDAQQLAFILFTSGSTGVPKGIAIEHSALCCSMFAMGQQLGMNSDSRVLQFSSFTFDAHLFDIFVTLHFGGCVCVPSDDQRSNDLAGAINSLRVNVLNLTPTVASMIQPQDVPLVSMLIMVGEAVTKGVVAAWSSVRPVRLFNGYGPAETYVASLIEITPESQALTSPSNIGFALNGNRFWVSDPLNYERLMPVGCIGELLIEGLTLARGYLNQPEKTAEVFLEVPASWAHLGPDREGNEARRIYKTGDLVRYSQDGSVDYVGRKDTQVKVHGQRVELAEIEYHLNTAVPQGSHCVVIHATAGLCKGRLVAVIALPSDDGHTRLSSASEMRPVPASQVIESRPLISELRQKNFGKAADVYGAEPLVGGRCHSFDNFWQDEQVIHISVDSRH